MCWGGGGGGGVQTLTKIAKILHVHIFSQGAYVKNWPACNDKKSFFWNTLAYPLTTQTCILYD